MHKKIVLWGVLLYTCTHVTAIKLGLYTHFFLENYVTSEEQFLTMFYTINSSPLLVTK